MLSNMMMINSLRFKRLFLIYPLLQENVQVSEFPPNQLNPLIKPLRLKRLICPFVSLSLKLLALKHQQKPNLFVRKPLRCQWMKLRKNNGKKN